MAKGNNNSNTTSNKGGESKAALRAEQEAVSKASKKAERARIKAAKEAKQADLAAALAAAQQANATREQARIAAANKSPEDLLKGVVGEYYLPSTFKDEEDGVPHERTEMVWIRVFESENGNVPMFQLLEDQMGIPVYLLCKQPHGIYVPYEKAHYKVKNEMRNCFFYVYNAVKGVVAEQQAKRAASDAAKAVRKAAVHSNHESRSTHAPLTSTERAQSFAKNAKKGRDAAIGIAAGALGQYLLGDSVFTIVGDSGSKVIRYVGSLPNADASIGMKVDSFLRLDFLKMESLPDTEKIKPEVLSAQRALHGFVHNFCKENGVRAKPAVAQATRSGTDI